MEVGIEDKRKAPAAASVPSCRVCFDPIKDDNDLIQIRPCECTFCKECFILFVLQKRMVCNFVCSDCIVPINSIRTSKHEYLYTKDLWTKVTISTVANNNNKTNNMNQTSAAACTDIFVVENERDKNIKMTSSLLQPSSVVQDQPTSSPPPSVLAPAAAKPLAILATACGKSTDSLQPLKFSQPKPSSVQVTTPNDVANGPDVATGATLVEKPPVLDAKSGKSTDTTFDKNKNNNDGEKIAADITTIDNDDSDSNNSNIDSMTTNNTKTPTKQKIDTAPQSNCKRVTRSSFRSNDNSAAYILLDINSRKDVSDANGVDTNNLNNKNDAKKKMPIKQNQRTTPESTSTRKTRSSLKSDDNSVGHTSAGNNDDRNKRSVVKPTTDDYIEELKAYKEENGHCMVKFTANPNLARFGYQVRNGQRKITTEQRRKLDKLGFPWIIENKKDCVDDNNNDINENKRTNDKHTPAKRKQGTTRESTSVKKKRTALKSDDNAGKSKYVKKNIMKSTDICIKELKAFKQVNGHCLVKFSANPSLARFGYQVRNGQRKITTEQRQKLDALGFPWIIQKKKDLTTYDKTDDNESKGPSAMTTPAKRKKDTTPESNKKRKLSASMVDNNSVSKKTNGKSIDEYIEELKAYKEKNGHCEVQERENQSLANLSYRIRRGIRKVTTEQRKKLDELGFQWIKEKKKKEGKPAKNPLYTPLTTDEFIEELKNYKEENGHVIISHNDNQKLANLGYRIRTGYREITTEQRQKLDDIGFVWFKEKHKTWKPKKKPTFYGRKTFEERIKDLEDYKKQHGDVNVPYSSSPDPTLGPWVKDVRCGQKTITKEQRKLLNRIGFIWETRTNRLEREWNEKLDKVKKFKELHGHTKLPSNFDKSLVDWCNTQRKLNNKNNLRADRKDALNSIGFFWGVVNTYNASNDDNSSIHNLQSIRDIEWNEKLERVKKYKEEHGHTNVYYKFDKPLFDWCQNQRVLNNENKLRTDRKDALNSIGFIWDINKNDNNDSNNLQYRRDKEWNEKLEKVKKYKEIHGHTKIKYKVDRQLYEWCCKQRKLNNKNQLRTDRKDALNSIGFYWGKKKNMNDDSNEISNNDSNYNDSMNNIENDQGGASKNNDDNDVADDDKNSNYCQNECNDRKDDLDDDNSDNNNIQNDDDKNSICQNELDDLVTNNTADFDINDYL